MRRLAPLLLLALAAASCGGPRQLLLDPADPAGVRARDARATLRKRGRLELVASRDRFALLIPRAALEGAGANSPAGSPVLRAVLRPTSRPPAPMRGALVARAGAASWSSPFDLGIPSPGRTVELWVDVPRAGPEGAEAMPLDALELRLDAAPGRIEVLRLELWPRTLRSRLELLGGRIRDRGSLEGGALAALLVLLAGTAAALAEVAGAVLRLPRPLPPAVAGNALARLARIWPRRTLAAAAAGVALLGAASILRSAADLHAAWRVAGTLTDRDHWDVRMANAHRDLLPLVHDLSLAVPGDATMTLAARRLDPKGSAAARFALWPRSVDASAEPGARSGWFAALGKEALPSLTQTRSGRWLSLEPESPVGQVYQVPQPGRYIVAVELRARDLEPGETLQLLLHATGRGHKIHGLAESRGSATFQLDPPVWLDAAEARFQVVLLGGGDGKVQISAARGNHYTEGFAVAKDARWGDDLVFAIRMAPAGFEPVKRVGGDSHLFRRVAP